MAVIYLEYRGLSYQKLENHIRKSHPHFLVKIVHDGDPHWAIVGINQSKTSPDPFVFQSDFENAEAKDRSEKIGKPF